MHGRLSRNFTTGILFYRDLHKCADCRSCDFDWNAQGSTWLLKRFLFHHTALVEKIPLLFIET